MRRTRSNPTESIPSEIEQSVTDMAKLVGVEPQQIRIMRANWREYMRQGLLVDLHIGRWRASSSLGFEDLGIPLDKSYDLIKLGEKRLLPVIPQMSKFFDPKKPTRTYGQLLDSVETAARTHLKANAFSTYWGNFVPVTQFEKWRTEFEGERVKRYLEIRDEIVSLWEYVVDDLREEYRRFAEDSYQRVMRLDSGESLKRRDLLGMEAFVKKFLNRIESLLPTREQFKASFYIEADYSYIPLPDLLAREESIAQRLRDERMVAVEKAESERQIEERRRLLEIEKIDDERRAVETAAQTRERQLREMNKLVLDSARQRKTEQIDNFIGSVTSQLRQMILDVVVNVQDSIRRNSKDGDGMLVGKAAQSLRNLIENVQGLNFTGDQEIENLLAPIRLALAKDNKNRDVNTLNREIDNLASELRSQIVGINIALEARSEEVYEVQPVEIERNERPSLTMDYFAIDMSPSRGRDL